MFGRKSGVLEREVPSSPLVSEVVAGISGAIEELIPQLQHKERIRDLTGVDHISGLSSELVKSLQSKGFTLFVTGDRVFRGFLYHATVWVPRGTAIGAFPVFNSSLWGAVPYVGDIPEYALDRIETLKGLGLEYGTIHSMQSLPISMALCDPVLIGWAVSPHMDIGRRSGIRLDTRGVGVIAAMWDMDKELVL